MESGNRARPTALGRDAKIEKLKKLIEGFRDFIGQIQDSEIKEKSESVLKELKIIVSKNKHTKLTPVDSMSVNQINVLIELVENAKLLLEMPTKESLTQGEETLEKLEELSFQDSTNFGNLCFTFNLLISEVEVNLDAPVEPISHDPEIEVVPVSPTKGEEADHSGSTTPVSSYVQFPKDGTHTEIVKPSNSASSPVISELFAEEKKLWRNRFKEMLQGYLSDKDKALDALIGRKSIDRIDGLEITLQDIQEALQELDGNEGKFKTNGKYKFHDEGRTVGGFIDAFAESNQPLDKKGREAVYSDQNTEMLKNTLSTTLGLSYSEQMIYEALLQTVYGDLIIEYNIEKPYKDVYNNPSMLELMEEYLADQQSFRKECYRIAGNAILQHHLIKVLDELRQVLPVSNVPNNTPQNCMVAGREIFTEVSKALRQGEFDFNKVTTKELIHIIELVRLTKTAIVEPANEKLIPRLTQNLEHLRSNIPSKPTAFKYKLLGAGLAVLGVALIGLAIATAVVSHGASTPLSIAGISIGVNIILGGLAMAGVGVFASLAGASISFGMWERTAAKEKQLRRFHGIQKAGGKVKAAVQKAEQNPKVSSGDSSLDLPIPGKFK